MRTFGLIGRSLSHSFSQTYFTQKFYRLGLKDCRYELFELASPRELPDLLAKHPDLAGLNVTIPYKEEIWPYLTDVASSAALVGAVNVIEMRADGSLIGHNTDYVGFRESLRPFYPARGLRGMTRASHAAALGFAGPASLSRLCDLATTERPAGAPLFWTLGANQTGKAAISAWRDWLAPALAAGAPYRFWPFEGGLRALLAPGTAVLAETYPAEAMRHLGVVLHGSKRVPEARRAAEPSLRLAMGRLHVAPAPALVAALQSGFGADALGEDRFDSLLGLLCVIGVLDGARPDTVPDDPWVRRWEGWVLGQDAVPVHPAPLPFPP